MRTALSSTITLVGCYEMGTVSDMRTDRRFVPSSYRQYDDAIQRIVRHVYPASSESDETELENDMLTCGTTVS